MTLSTMRRHGVRGLFVTCQHCGHERAVNMTTGEMALRCHPSDRGSAVAAAANLVRPLCPVGLNWPTDYHVAPGDDVAALYLLD
jgi:hypothetical protein